MKQKNKDILSIIFIGILILGITLMMFALAIKGYNNSNIELNQVNSCKGYVTDKGISLKKGKLNLSIFYFKINGTKEKFTSYNKSQDYSKLVNEIKIGNILKVYYKKASSSDFTVNVIQIEKNGTILLGKSEYESKEKSLIYIGIFAGLAMLILFIKFIVIMKSKINTSNRSCL